MFKLAAGTKQGRPRDTGCTLGTTLGPGEGLDGVPGSGQGNEPGAAAPGSAGLFGGSPFSDFLLLCCHRSLSYDSKSQSKA